MKQKTIRLSRIRISLEMKAHMPHPEKLKKKYYIFKTTGKLHSPILLDRKKNLLDGYTSYLIAKMFGIKKVDVIIQENKSQMRK